MKVSQADEALQKRIAALEKALQELAEFPDENPSPVMRATRDGTILYANRASQVLLGQLEVGVQGPRLPDRWLPVVAEALDTGTIRTLELEGSDETFELSLVPMHTGGYLNIYGSNATRRVRAERALQLSSEQRAQALFDSAPIAISWAHDAKVSYANPAHLAMFGYNTADLCGRPLTDQIAPACRAEIAERTRTRAQGATVPNIYETTGLRRDGSEFPMIIQASMMRLSDGPAVVAFCTDITERKRAMDLLAMRARQQAVVAELGQAALTGVGAQALMDRAVAQVATTLDIACSKLLELLPDGDALLLRAGVGWREGLVGSATVPAGLASQAGYVLQTKQPVIVTDLNAETRFTATPLLHEHGVVSGVGVMIADAEKPFGVLSAHATHRRDFTQDDINFLQAVANVIATAVQHERADRALRNTVQALQRAHEELEQAAEQLEERVQQRTAELQIANAVLAQREAALEASNKELEAFSYSVSHDLRAPLRAIDGYSRILLAECSAALPSEGQHYLTAVRSNVQQMGRLIDDVLALSRLDRQAISLQSVSPVPIVRDCLDRLAGEREGRDVEVAIADLPRCRADPQLLTQVYFNLLSNALKFTRRRQQAVIEVGFQQEDGVITYYVKDNGIGFDMRYAGKLFGVFQRLHRAEDYEGTGVGLAIVQRIVRRHGGRAWAEATPDQGATLYFTIGEPKND